MYCHVQHIDPKLLVLPDAPIQIPYIDHSAIMTTYGAASDD